MWQSASRPPSGTIKCLICVSVLCPSVFCCSCYFRIAVFFLYFVYLRDKCSVLFLSRPRSEGGPHHGRTSSIYFYHLPFWLTRPPGVLSATLRCLSRPCVVFLAWVHPAVFLALFLSPGNSPLSSWCDHCVLASLLWRCLTVPSTPALLRTDSFVFFAAHETRTIFLSPFISKASRRDILTVFLLFDLSELFPV